MYFSVNKFVLPHISMKVYLFSATMGIIHRIYFHVTDNLDFTAFAFSSEAVKLIKIQ